MRSPGDRQRAAVVLPLALCLALPLCAAPTAAKDRADFTGLWTLDEKASDDPVEKWREAVENQERRTVRGGRPRIPDELTQTGERPEDRLRALVEGVEELNIDHEGDLLRVRYKNGRERLLYTDGRELGAELENGLLDAKATWKKGTIVVKGESARGGRRTEVFELSEDGKELTVTVTLAGRGARAPTVTFRRVYRGLDFDLFGG